MRLTSLGPYRLERALGHGGMGTVYAGVHEESGQRAALKVLSESLSADPRFRERFRGEVDTLRLLHHDHIVQLLGYGEERGRLFFVMELVDGPSLESQLQAGQRFDWQQTSAIAIQVCRALKHAHDHGVIHRDLKPANLLIDAQGRVKLTDFGIAKLFGVSGLTLAGSMIGTPDYMAPEQTEGHPATPASDLYSLGCVMYALMTGKPPFAGSSVTEVIGKVRFSEAIPLKRLAPETPQELDRIVAQLLSKNPAQRVATPQALAHLLQAMLHALADKTVEAAPPPEDAGDPGEMTLHLPSDALPTGERPTLDFQPEQVERAEIGKSDFRLNLPNRGQPPWHRAFVSSPQQETHTGRSQQAQFTAVAPGSEPRGRFVQGPETAASRREWLTLAAGGCLLAGIVAAVVWALLPLSADRLYQRIQESSRQNVPPDRYLPDLGEFLQRFPADSRSGDVQRLREEYLVQSLRGELGIKVRSLSEPEKLYLRGLELADGGRNLEACGCFQQVVGELAADEPTGLGASDRRLLERTRYLARKLGCSPAENP